MLTLEEIIEKLQDKRISYVADQIGVTPAYLYAIMSGKAVNPSYSVVKKLSDYLSR
jgi:transcriptional regulator with XRE-family HTH domain